MTTATTPRPLQCAYFVPTPTTPMYMYRIYSDYFNVHLSYPPRLHQCAHNLITSAASMCTQPTHFGCINAHVIFSTHTHHSVPKPVPFAVIATAQYQDRFLLLPSTKLRIKIRSFCCRHHHPVPRSTLHAAFFSSIWFRDNSGLLWSTDSSRKWVNRLYQIPICQL